MRSSGNGNPAVCAENLLKLSRGEVPYERVKGLDPRLIDSPASSAVEDLEQDAEWLLETYEPRVTANGFGVTPPDAAAGGYIVTAEISEKEEG